MVRSKEVPAHVIAVSGRIASGKSTLADSLASETGWPVASFGAYVRSVAEQRGLGTDRPTLQAIGSELVRDGEEPFVIAVLRAAGWRPGRPAVVEGVRHLTVLRTVRRVAAPLPVLHVHVALSETERNARTVARGDTESAENHDTERDARVILEHVADVMADGAADPVAQAAEIVRRL